jgi:hypothetical protein
VNMNISLLREEELNDVCGGIQQHGAGYTPGDGMQEILASGSTPNGYVVAQSDTFANVGDLVQFIRENGSIPGT